MSVHRQSMDAMSGAAAATRAASRLEVWDYLSMSGVVLLASCVGIYHIFAARGSKDAREFVVTSRDIGVMPLILSAIASYISAVGILGFPVETYTNGAVFIPICLAPLLIAPISVYLYLPVFFKLGSATIFEYLEFRFNRSLRLLSSILLTFQLLLYTACVIYAPALALNQVTGLNLWNSVLSIGAICILYTSMGGIKAVVFADAAQMIVMVSVLGLIVIRGVYDIGGVSEVWRIAIEGKRADIFLFSSSPNSGYTSWTVLFAGSFHCMGPIAINQLMMQRYLSNNTLKKAQISFMGGCIGIGIMSFLSAYAGLVVYARYHDCDPFLSGLVTSRDQLLALFGVETLSFCKGLPGIFVGCILCATLSTLSSTLNSLTAVTLEDYIRPCYPNISEATAMRISKILGLVYGVICVALVAVAESLGGVIKAVFGIVGMTAGPVLSLFTVGMFFPWVTSIGAASGLFVSFAFSGVACIGNLLTKPVLPTAPFSCDGCDVEFSGNGNLSLSHLQLLNGSQTCDSNLVQTVVDSGFPLFAMSPLWYTFCSVCISTIVSLFVSLVFGTQNPSELDPKLLSPITLGICRRLPVHIQRRLGFGPIKKSVAELETRYSELPLKVVVTDEDFSKSFPPSDSQLT